MRTTGRADRPRSVGGFTLIELMLVVAIIGVVASLAVASFQGIGKRSAPQNFSYELYSTLLQARAKAIERGADVWFIIYPTVAAPGSSASGGGGWFVVEDADINFATAGTLNYTNLDPTAAVTAGERDRVMSAVYLDRDAGKGAAFGAPQGVTFSGPFTSLPALTNGCSFCSGAPSRGAIVFSGDGSARFVDGAGALVAGRVAGLGLRGTANTRAGALIGIAAATGFIGSYR